MIIKTIFVRNVDFSIERFEFATTNNINNNNSEARVFAVPHVVVFPS